MYKILENSKDGVIYIYRCLVYYFGEIPEVIKPFHISPGLWTTCPPSTRALSLFPTQTPYDWYCGRSLCLRDTDKKEILRQFLGQLLR